jgi:hypothetical protein
MPLLCRSASEPQAKFERPALVVGHPGHELKVFGWLAECQPRVHVITDGSGRSGISRISSTARVLALAGAPRGEIFAYMSDAEIYRAMLEQDAPVFFPLVDALARSFLTHEIDSVVGDAAEGFNPAHDLCRGLIDSAVLLAERTSGKKIANFEICLTEWEQNGRRALHDERCLHWELDDCRLEQKIAAAEEYAELTAEVQRAIAARGKEYFRSECLRCTVATDLAHFDAGRPGYEAWGERRVAEGHYQTVIRFHQHVLPLMQTILDYAGRTLLAPSPAETKR